MLPNELDLVGWDLAKTLRLFASCNLALNEWMASPVVYWEQQGFRQELSKLIPKFFKPRKAIHHYLSIAKGTARDHFNGSEIKIKKLFYVLRPLFACHWIDQNASMPPTIFQAMIDQYLVEDDILSAIRNVQKQKEVALEGHVIEVPKIIKAWIYESIIHFEKVENNFLSGDKAGWGELNEIMLKWSV